MSEITENNAIGLPEGDSKNMINIEAASAIQNEKDNKATDKQRHRGKDEKRDRKKDDKSVEHVLKALNSLNTTEEKLAAMCKKYADMFNDHRILQNTVKQAEKKCSILQREKEQLQADHSKAILTRSTLENLCRELQRQNKAVKEESMMRIREEEEKRKEVSAKFQSTLNEITVVMQANSDKNSKLRDDNKDMTQKLKSVYEQYEKREEHVEKLAKQMQLEVQLAEAKLAKATMEMAVEKETLLREKKQLLVEIAEYKARLEEMQVTELSLRSQISLYNNKYDDFHRALIQSNEAISGFKSEMDKMSKQIRRLERETGSWRNRYEGAQAALARMSEEKLRLEAELGTTSRKLGVLHRLCHTLQDNRRATDKGEAAVHSEATLKAQLEEVNSLEECPSKSPQSTVQSPSVEINQSPQQANGESCPSTNMKIEEENETANSMELHKDVERKLETSAGAFTTLNTNLEEQNTTGGTNAVTSLDRVFINEEVSIQEEKEAVCLETERMPPIPICPPKIGFEEERLCEKAVGRQAESKIVGELCINGSETICGSQSLHEEKSSSEELPSPNQLKQGNETIIGGKRKSKNQNGSKSLNQ